MKLFFDTEFTGLQQDTSLISLAFVSEDNKRFYAEFTDYNKNQCDPWIQQHVIQNTLWLQHNTTPETSTNNQNRQILGDKQQVKNALLNWLEQFDSIQVWADVPCWDWMLFCQLFGGALHIPKHIFYMPMDLATLFECKRLNADTNRIEFADMQNSSEQHNALYDAQVLKACYEKLVSHD